MEQLGGEEKLRKEYPRVHDLLCSVQEEDRTACKTPRERAGLQMNYCGITEVFGHESGIDVQARTDFKNPQEIVIVNTVISNADTGEILDNFCTYNENVTYMEKLYRSVTQASKEASRGRVKIETDFIWAKDGVGDKIKKKLYRESVLRRRSCNSKK